MRTLVIAAVLLLAAGQAFACRMLVSAPGQDIADADSGFGVRWHFVPAQPKVGEFFSVEFFVCWQGVPIPAETLRVDAIMPAHRHGMNFQPKIVALGDASFRAEGLMFHMPGIWQVIFERRFSDGTGRAVATIEIE